MALSKTRSLRNDPHTWPGFVDALAALLMVVIFVLMIFSLAQFYLNQIVSGQDEALFDLNKEISDLYRLLQLEKESNTNLNDQINQLKLNFETTNKNLSEEIKENDALSEIILSLKKTLSDTQDNLNKTEIELSNLKQKNIQDYSSFDSKISELEKNLSINRDELAIKIDDILQLEKIKSNLQLEVENLISKDREINADLLQERDYSKTLEEKIASLKDKALLTQKQNSESSNEIIKLRSQINTLKVALSEVNLKLKGGSKSVVVPVGNETISSLKQLFTKAIQTWAKPKLTIQKIPSMIKKHRSLWVLEALSKIAIILLHWEN